MSVDPAGTGGSTSFSSLSVETAGPSPVELVGTGLGLILPTFPQHADVPSAAALTALCQGAELAGASALWACDHLYWHRPHLECLTTLGLAVAATARCAVGSCVLQLPLRAPVVVAKEAASLWHLSGGRLVLGVGAGSRQQEYEAAGADFTTRGRALDAGVTELRRHWAADEGAAPDGCRQLPPAPAMPVWVGGSSEASLRRAALLGDGWIPLFVPVDEYGAAAERLAIEARRAGRHERDVLAAVTVFCSLAADGDDDTAAERGLEWMSSLYGLPGRAFRRHLLVGSARRCAEGLAGFVEMGARHVGVFVAADDPLVQFEDLAGAFASLDAVPGRDALPPVRPANGA